MITATRTLTIDDAARVAGFFDGQSNVLDVYLFGGIARSGRSSKDIDLILVTNQQIYGHFISRLQRRRQADGYMLPETRFTIAQDLLHWGDAALARICTTSLLDLFIFPENWLAQLSQINRAIRTSNPTFTLNVAKDARLYDPAARMFLPGKA